MSNLKDNIPAELPQEVFTDLLVAEGVRIERILSQGHSSPASGWYDQDEHEWVLVLEGAGELTFENGDKVQLRAGDYLNIPAHTRHRVSWTDPEQRTVWLAVFYR
ncbi:cupin domain-containing protein [Marinobacterium sp. AK62]|uniref:Cupin domain-containing protein n=1 Tax=Marinobacterium alkalitolerans TaxID=1542925 RepID=A0ABS3ZC42_9GAMM|nr:cupin domain-containing protein [Marinobacterium alkalitolerans]MBP0049266.1 cupin domain-containing protein [Marinobacterium alkalitolerans]